MKIMMWLREQGKGKREQRAENKMTKINILLLIIFMILCYIIGKH